MLKASELIEKLQKLIQEHGDLPVYGRIDNEWVENAEYAPANPILFYTPEEHINITDG